MSAAPFVDDVKAFHDKFGLATPPAFTKLSDELHKFRSGFFTEELTEYEDAVRAGDLSTTLDSLIDLIYIISGAALLHGLTGDELAAAGAIASDFFDEGSVLQGNYGVQPTTVSLPDQAVADAFSAVMRAHIDAYDQLHAASDEELPPVARKHYVLSVLGAMATSCFVAAEYSGTTEALWDELWADVQRANMSKERATKATDSKRGSTFDVIKPAGWVGPQTDAIIAKHQALAA
jgi:predicted HAD superfamily Cof-like phosphohydrolase